MRSKKPDQNAPAAALSPTVDVEFARLWLAGLQAVLIERPNESPQRLGLSQFFTLNLARELWDKGAGEFDHAIAVLAVDNNVAFTPIGGVAATIIRLAIPGAKPSLVSTWGALLNAVWAHQIDMADIQALGIYRAKKAISGNYFPESPTRTSSSAAASSIARGIRRGELPAWSRQKK